MKNTLITHVEPKSPISECFRALRTNLQFKNSNKEIKTILVTSTIQSEGKSTATANLAITFAQAGKKTIIIDADLRRTTQHKIFGISQIPGFSNYLLGIDDEGNYTDEHISAYIKETEIENLDILPAGTIPPNPSELLASNATINMIEKLKLIYDIIIFDGTPSVLVTDAIILSRIADTTLILAAYKETKMDDLKKIQKDIENVGGNIAGVILNKYPISKNKYNDTYYYGTTGADKFKGTINMNAITNEKTEKVETGRIETYSSDIENFSQDLSVSMDTVSIVDEKYKLELDRKIGKIEYVIEKLENRIKEATGRADETATQEVTEKINELKSRIEELEEAKAEGASEEVEQKIAEINSKVEELEGTASETKENITQEVYDEMAKINLKISEVLETVEAKKDENQDLEAKVSDLKSKVEELIIVKGAGEDVNQEVYNKISELKDKIEAFELGEELKESTAVLNPELENLVEELKVKLEELEVERETERIVDRGIKNNVDEMSAKIEELGNRIEEMQNVDSEESMTNEVSNKIASLEEQLEGIRNKIEDMKLVNEDYENEGQEVDSKVEELNVKIEELVDKISAMEETISESSETEEPEVSSKIEEMNSRIEELVSKISAMEVINDANDAEGEAVENKVAKLNTKLEELEDKIDGIEVINETKDITEQEVESKVDELVSKIEELESKISELTEARETELKEKAKVVDMRDFVGSNSKNESDEDDGESDPIWYTKPEKNVKLYEIEIAVGEEGERLIREINDSMVVGEKIVSNEEVTTKRKVVE